MGGYPEETVPPLRQRWTPPPEKRENMPQNLCVLDPASTGTAESSGGVRKTQL